MINPPPAPSAALPCWGYDYLPFGVCLIILRPRSGGHTNEGTQTMTKTLNKNDLQHFTGTENWYRHSLNRTVLYTDGVKYMAEQGGAFWLVDEIALAQRFEACLQNEHFQVWQLKVNDNNTATLTCEDGDDLTLFSKGISFTDFPLPEIILYFCNNVILLPSEY
jgi:hypothetical protein